MAAERVLSETCGLGFTATELGPKGFLPEDPASLRRLLERHRLRLVAGFVPAVLHVESVRERELAAVEEQARTLAEGGAASNGRERFSRSRTSLPFRPAGRRAGRAGRPHHPR